jgi:hypothetical protein
MTSHESFTERSPQSHQTAIPAAPATPREAACGDHAAWLTALAVWRTDIDRWQQEHGSALARLRLLQRAIEDHGRCLVNHLQSFTRVADAVADHERLLDSQRPVSPHDREMFADRHLRCGTLMTQLEDTQRRIACHHDEFMRRMAALEEAAAAAM